MPGTMPDSSTDDLVLVLWRDAWFVSDGSTDHDDYLVQTVGWRIGQDAKFLHVASELLPYGDGERAVTHIPNGMVLTITPLIAAEGGA